MLHSKLLIWNLKSKKQAFRGVPTVSGSTYAHIKGAQTTYQKHISVAVYEIQKGNFSIRPSLFKFIFKFLFFKVSKWVIFGGPNILFILFNLFKMNPNVWNVRI